MLTSPFIFQVAQPNPVSADPGDEGSHGGEVEKEGGGTGTDEFREIRQIPPGKFREQSRQEERRGGKRQRRLLFQEETVALFVAEGVVVLADEGGGVDSAEETQLWQRQVVAALILHRNQISHC